MISDEEKALLKKLVRTHGAYEVTKALSQVCEGACEGMHDEAIIHRDSAILATTVAEMKQAHFLRSVRD